MTFKPSLFVFVVLVSICWMAFTGPVDSLKFVATPKFQKVPVDTGYATFYGNLWHGRRTASGLPYHKDSLTCAHLKYPFGTRLLVTNLKNGKKVVVKVTDRGPHVKSRIIDLSMAAAQKISMVSDGVVKVSVQRAD